MREHAEEICCCCFVIAVSVVERAKSHKERPQRRKSAQRARRAVCVWRVRAAPRARARAGRYDAAIMRYTEQRKTPTTITTRPPVEETYMHD